MSILEGNDPQVLARRRKIFRVAEIFGPTIQGEGRNVGMPCHFIRLGGCDFRCSWCDTPHAVLPDLVAKLPQMTVWDIITKLQMLDRGTHRRIQWVVLTGGNPGLLDLEYLVALLHKRHYNVMLETQGTTFREWFGDIDDLCFSPKPPSSGNITELNLLNRVLTHTMNAAVRRAGEQGREMFYLPYLKIPIFDDQDLEYAQDVHQRFPDLEMYLSIGNTDPSLPTVGNPNPDPRIIYPTEALVLDNFKRVLEMVLTSYPALQDCKIFPQQHTLLWGNARGH